jgi:hypothetical protein
MDPQPHALVKEAQVQARIVKMLLALPEAGQKRIVAALAEYFA